MDPSMAFEGLLIFHSFLTIFFILMHCRLTRKQPEALRRTTLMSVVGVFSGLFVIYVEMGWNPLWVNFTGFQLALGSTYVVASTLHARAFDLFGKRRK